MPWREVSELRLLLRDDESEPDDEGDLDELRRLELHLTDREPVGVAADGDAERRGHDEQLECAGDDEQRPRDRHPRPLGHAARDQHDRDAEQGVEALSCRLHEEAAVFEVRFDRRRREHHDEPEHDEEEGRAEQQEVVLRLDAEDASEPDAGSRDARRLSLGLSGRAGRSRHPPHLPALL